MANLVKAKVKGFIFFSVLLLFSFLIYVTNNTTDRFFYWHQDSVLTVADFQKAHPILRDRFDAALFGGIRIIEVNNRPHAVVFIDRFKSWYDESMYSDQLMNHEKYHANIYQVFADSINREIKRSNLPLYKAKLLLKKLQPFVSKYQHKYDNETNHNLNEQNQIYWEYKIDSTLNKGRILNTTDWFSGASAYFPDQPKVFIQKDTFMLFRVFQLEKYKMKFRFITKYDQFVDTTNYEKHFTDFLASLNFVDISSVQSQYNKMLMVETHCSDTANGRRFHDRIIYDGRHEYQLTVFHPLLLENDSLYSKMINQFFESFTIKNQEMFWKRELDDRKMKNAREVSVSENAKGNFESFTSLPYSDCSLMYHSPFIIKNELVIPFKSERHKTTDIKEVLVILNDERIFSQEADSTYQFIRLKLSDLKTSKNNIKFGYLTKSDSTKKRDHLYSSLIKDYKVSIE